MKKERLWVVYGVFVLLLAVIFPNDKGENTGMIIYLFAVSFAYIMYYLWGDRIIDWIMSLFQKKKGKKVTVKVRPSVCLFVVEFHEGRFQYEMQFCEEVCDNQKLMDLDIAINMAKKKKRDILIKQGRGDHE